LLQNTNLTRAIELDDELIKFKSNLIHDQQDRLKDHIEVEVRDISYLNNLD